MSIILGAIGGALIGWALASVATAYGWNPALQPATPPAPVRDLAAERAALDALQTFIDALIAESLVFPDGDLEAGTSRRFAELTVQAQDDLLDAVRGVRP